MLYLLSPAKTLDYESPLPAGLAERATRPQFVDEAAALIEVLRGCSPARIASLMSLSDPLAQLNVGRYAAWSRRFTSANSRPAVLAFNGDVYEGLQAATLSAAELSWAQRHLAILSGLYGVLRPLDKLQPYRLEMGTRLPTPGAKDLYGYWGDTIAEALNAWQAGERAPVVVNLASQEYARAALRPALRARVVDCHFEDWHGGRWKVISFHAKRARGLMARYAIQHRVARPKALQGFDSEGYAFDAAASEADRLVFRRRLSG
ncbi:MAG: peroxide stress protein YaaA [Vitreoscilla sp.]|nr:peroxide stress protein YaaA [Vitreoscilla sp.]